MQDIIWNEVMVHQKFFTGSSGEIKKGRLFKSHKTMAEIFLLLFEFCYKSAGMNEVTAREAIKDAMMQRTRRVG